MVMLLLHFTLSLITVIFLLNYGDIVIDFFKNLFKRKDPIPDSTCKYRIIQTKSSANDKLVYDLYYSKDHKKYIFLKTFYSQEKAEEEMKLYVENNKIIREYDPNILGITDGSEKEFIEDYEKRI